MNASAVACRPPRAPDAFQALATRSGTDSLEISWELACDLQSSFAAGGFTRRQQPGIPRKR
jgi:hypothetical protein